MNEIHSDGEQADRGGEDTATSEARSNAVSVKRILLVVIPVGLLIVIAAAFFGVFDGAEWVRGLMQPPLVCADVRVTYRGQPLANATVMTEPTADLPGAIGMPGEEPGLYVLRTDLQGHYNDGAYAGEHKVTVAAHKVTAAPAAPLLTPTKYSTLDTTDLVITVSRSPESNHFVLELEDDESGSVDDSGAASRGEADTELPTADQIVERVFNEFDKDGDQNLSGEEIEQIDNEQQRTGIQRADVDGDGVVDREELAKAVEPLSRDRKAVPEVVQDED
jgi:Ca2+-binding EF-hand superfamily protein